MAEQIHIRQVLATMDMYENANKPVEFSLEFITIKGEKRVLNRAAKGHKSTRTSNGQSNFGYSLKESGIVLIRDLDFNNGVGRSISVKIDGIRKFNNLTVFH